MSVDHHLTTREQQVCNLLAQDKSYAPIAANLRIKIETVRTHIHRIHMKLDAWQSEETLQAMRPEPEIRFWRPWEKHERPQ